MANELVKVAIPDNVPVASMRGIVGEEQQTGLKAFRSLLESRRGTLAAVSASFLSPDRVIKVLLNSMAKTPKLMECTGSSIFRSVLAAAELGLEPGGALQQAYLVPYKSECTLIVGYRGLVELAYRSGSVVSVNAEAVYAGDVYEEEGGLAPKLRHVKGDGPRDADKMVRVYAVIHLKGDGLVYGSMTRAEVDAVRSRSSAGKSGPWVTDYAEMAKKTVLRRVLKLAPMSVELHKALALENAVDAGEPTEGILDVDLPEQTQAEQVTDLLTPGPTAAPVVRTTSAKGGLAGMMQALEEAGLTTPGADGRNNVTPDGFRAIDAFKAAWASEGRAELPKKWGEWPPEALRDCAMFVAAPAVDPFDDSASG